MKKLQPAFRASFAILITLLFGLPMQSVLAVSKEQKDAFRSGVYYFNTETEGSTCNPGQASITYTPSDGSSFDPVSMRFPIFPDEAKIGADITAYIQSVEPTSSWLTIPNVGSWLIGQAKTRDVNPLFVFGSGKIESQFGTSDVGRAHNNFFGIKSGDSYRHFNTPSDGLLYFLDDLKENTQGGDSIYSKATNIYEYFSIHQTGSIVYPGEDFDPRDVDQFSGNTKDLYDPNMNVWISWDPNKNANNPNPDRRGQYTPLIYYKLMAEILNEALGLGIPAENPGRGSGTFCSGSTGNLDTTGYAFPLEPQTKAIGGIRVGQTATAHHDGTPAFDLFTPVRDADVYALYGGTAIRINQSYGGVAGCTSIQFLADDGFYYWHGHLKNPAVREGQHVTAGTKLAEIADAGFGSDCIGGGVHLHIDRGCITSDGPQPGGYDDCRDPGFIPFLSTIYERLPD